MHAKADSNPGPSRPEGTSWAFATGREEEGQTVRYITHEGRA